MKCELNNFELKTKEITHLNLLILIMSLILYFDGILFDVMKIVMGSLFIDKITI